MYVEKEFLIKSSPKSVWDLISNPKLFGKSCIPNLKSYKEINKKKFVVKVTPLFAFLKSSITMDWKILGLGKNKGRLNINGKLIGSTFNVLTNLKVLKKNKDSLLKWDAEFELEGLLKLVPETIVKGAALKLAGIIFDRVANEVKK